MKQEALDFYEQHKIPVSKMIYVGVNKKGLSPESIKLAASEVYEDIINGRIQLPPIRIAWEVYARARYKRVESNKKENDQIKRLREQVRLVEVCVEFLRLPWWKRIFRRIEI